MFIYDKKLQYPVKIDRPNPRLAALIISQYGGPDGELGASLRYLSQRYSMPFDELKGLLTDIGTEASEILHTYDPRYALAYCRLFFMTLLFAISVFVQNSIGFIKQFPGDDRLVMIFNNHKFFLTLVVFLVVGKIIWGVGFLLNQIPAVFFVAKQPQNDSI